MYALESNIYIYQFPELFKCKLNQIRYNAKKFTQVILNLRYHIVSTYESPLHIYEHFHFTHLSRVAHIPWLNVPFSSDLHRDLHFLIFKNTSSLFYEIIN